MFYSSDAAFIGSGEGSLFVTEKFGLEQRGGQRGTVDGDQGTSGAATELVDGLSDKFFAGAAFSGDEHRGGGGTDLLDLFEHLPDGWSFADEALHTEALIETLMELLVFGFESVAPKGSLNAQLQLIDLQASLADVVVGALLHGLDGQVFGTVGRHQDADRRFR